MKTKTLVHGIAGLLASVVLGGSAALYGAGRKASGNADVSGSKNYSLIERTDLRRYDNEKYVGLTSREVRSFIANTTHDYTDVPEGCNYYDGNFYVVEKTLRNQTVSRTGLQKSVSARFMIDSEGSFTMLEDNGFPAFRAFPAYPKEKNMKPGDKWQATAERVVDPQNKAKPTRLSLLVEYTYIRKDTFNGQDVYVIEARWATRYGAPFASDPEGDPALRSAAGSHSALIYTSVQTGNALLIQDTVDEYFVYEGGTKIAFKGTISLFTEYPQTIDRAHIRRAIKNTAELTKSVEAADTASGLKLTIENVQFKPDSAELLPSESGRLDKIAAVLLQVPNATFLIEGHTASTGNSPGEMRLSEERAQTIALALIERGIPAEKCIYKGSGGTKPIADNTTELGRAKNRRVEITILE